MFSKIKDYILDQEFRFTLLEHRFFATNFSKILSLEDSEVSFFTSYGKVVIKGKDFVLQRLVESEVLIGGEVEEVKVFYE